MPETDNATGKPVVWYDGDAQFMTAFAAPDLEYAKVLAANHPTLGHRYVYTTRVVRKFNGGFETTDYIYQSFKLGE